MPMKKKKVIRKAVKKVRKSAKKVVRKVAGKGKAAKKGKTAKLKVKSKFDNMVKVAEVTHYFPHVKAAAMLILKDGVKVGDKIYIKGHTTDFKEKIVSIQLEHVTIEEAKKGQEIGLLVKDRVRIGDSVYKI